ncbi:MAG TPA: GNAT family N-acetyltransferase [Candidatus Eisenbacteria bacterium]|nr:GNAT family N-acetyltransferase [Candidatus Eisenbacteria bacterium]
MSWKLQPARAAFEEHRAFWDDLNRRGSGHVLLDSAFIAPLVRQFGSERTLLAVNTDPSSPGAMLLEARRGGFWNTFQPSQAPIGLALLPGSPDPSRPVRELMSRLPGYALEIGILQQDPEISDFRAAPPSGLVRVAPYIETARVSVRGSFSEYWNARGKDLKTNLERRVRRLDRQGIRHEVQIVRTADRIPEAIRDYARLEGTGWKAGMGTAVSSDNDQGRYYRDVLEALCERGEAAVFQLTLDGHVVASQLGVSRNGILVLLKMAYDEAFQEHSPGYILQHKILESVFQDSSMKSVEFYGRVRRGWTDKWTDETRTMVHVTFYRHSWVDPALKLVRSLARPRSRSESA